MTALSWAPDGRSIAVAAEDGTILVADTNSFETLYSLRSQISKANQLAWSPDGMTLAAASEGRISIWRNSEMQTLLYTKNQALEGWNSLVTEADSPRLGYIG